MRVWEGRIKERIQGLIMVNLCGRNGPIYMLRLESDDKKIQISINLRWKRDKVKHN
jgi:hypothetical protein